MDVVIVSLTVNNNAHTNNSYNISHHIYPDKINMFKNFPKTKIILPEEYQNILQRHYLENREGLTPVSSITKSMESWMHRKVAMDESIGSTLEIGAGTLNHLDYEPSSVPYDIVEPNFELLSKFPERLKYVRKSYKYIYNIRGKKKYKRIISIATFEHLLDLPSVVKKTGLLLRPDGVLRVAIPNEGTFLWKLGYTLTSGIMFKIKYGLDYNKIMEYEHVNTADEIEDVLKYFYSVVECKVMGISKNIGFYRFYTCREPKDSL